MTEQIARITKYRKLVRDHIPAIIRRNKAIPRVSYLRGGRFLEELKKKLVEEAVELRKTKGKNEALDELADVQEVVQALARALGIRWSEVEKKRKAKHKERGGFDKKIFLREVEKSG